MERDLKVMGSSAIAKDDVIEQIMRLQRSLPERPGLEEIEAAEALIRNVDREEQSRLEGIASQIKSRNVPEELFQILQQMQRSTIHMHSQEQKREAVKLLDLEGVHKVFDDLIQRASKCLLGESTNVSYSLSSTVNTTTAVSSSSAAKPSESEIIFAKDDLFLKKPKKSFRVESLEFGAQLGDALALKPVITSGECGEKLSLIKLASLIEVSAKKGTQKLNLQGKLSDQIEWLPDSIGKLSNMITLDLSENRIAVLSDAIGKLSALQIFDIHGNRISELPESIGNLLSLINLDLRGNQLNSLPPTIDRLVCLQELNLSSNGLSSLPDAIGSLISLKKLNIETNNIEEIPHTIGRCASLTELRADYNRLKALPEAIGRIVSLEILTVRYNNIRQLPTTMSSLTSLNELDLSFNELESVPESLCFATSLVKMNISNNFADLQSLPRSIGNLEMLEVLDMSNNQIRVLPDSFRMLTRLRVLDVEGNPLSVPPGNVIKRGPQAIVQYVGDMYAQKQVQSQSVKQKKSWTTICFFSKSNKRKRSGGEYSKAL